MVSIVVIPTDPANGFKELTLNAQKSPGHTPWSCDDPSSGDTPYNSGISFPKVASDTSGRIRVVGDFGPPIPRFPLRECFFSNRMVAT